MGDAGGQTARRELPPRPPPGWPVRKEGALSGDDKNWDDANANIDTYLFIGETSLRFSEYSSLRNLHLLRKSPDSSHVR